MTDTITSPQLDPSDFSMTDYDNVHIEMPPCPSPTDDDIDAQLFEYVASAEKDSGIASIADLNDAWVRSNFGGLSTAVELRALIRHDLEERSTCAYGDLKFQKCADALIARLEGDIPADVLEASIEASRDQYDERLSSFGMTKAQFLREERMTGDEFEKKLRDDVAYRLRLDVALDKMIEVMNVTVGNDELTQYLSCEDAAAFLVKLKDSGRVEDARHAAARVKVMRRIVETAVVEGQEETQR